LKGEDLYFPFGFLCRKFVEYFILHFSSFVMVDYQASWAVFTCSG